MDKFSPIEGWLERGSDLKSLLEPEGAKPNLELGGFLDLSTSIPIHESISLSAESLETSWSRATKFLDGVKEVLEWDEPGSLDRYELELVKEELGNPPPLAYPIYLMTVRSERDPERVVYIGKTSSETGRFSGGHRAITKLHQPKYDRLEKRMYLACVILLTDKNYLPLEWVQPYDFARELLHDVEALLTYDFQPDLNEQNKKHNNNHNSIYLTIQNIRNTDSFLHDHMCVPPADR